MWYSHVYLMRYKGNKPYKFVGYIGVRVGIAVLQKQGFSNVEDLKALIEELNRAIAIKVFKDHQKVLCRAIEELP